MERFGNGHCNGSFGELLQGVLPGNKRFLVTCRIKNQATVKIRLSKPGYSAEKEALFAKSYSRYPKSYKVLRNVMSDFGSHDDCFIEVNSELPIGKGLSSSTADMISGLRALGEAMSFVIKDQYIGRMLTEIEPNDGLQYDGTVIYQYLEGELLERYDYIPPGCILGVDMGGTLDTVLFNQHIINWSAKDMDCYAGLLEDLKNALVSKDIDWVGNVATQSTQNWQRVNPKLELDKILHFAEETQAKGVINTHSGTYLGILYCEKRTDLNEIYHELSAKLPEYGLRWFTTTSSKNREFILEGN